MSPSPEKLLDACAEAVLAVDADSLRIVAANHEAGQLLGLPARELVGRLISEFEVGLQDLCFWDEVRAGNRQNYSAVESEYRHHGGGLFAVRKTVRLLEEEGCYVVSAHDITAQQQIEEQTALANSLLTATLESTVDGILVTDLNGDVQHGNRRFCRQWQQADSVRAGADGRALFDRILAVLEDPLRVRRWIDELFADPQSEGQIECRVMDGRVFEIVSLPQRYKERAIGRVFSFHDISKLKAAEAELIAARDAAESANRAKSEFLSHMSHELRTPLNAILGFSQVLEDELDAPNRSLVEHISRAGHHLLDLINEVLDLSSIEAGKLHLQPVAVDLVAVVDDTVALLRPLASKRTVTLAVHALEHGRYFVMADARRLRQMLLNLVSNAIKYNREHGKVTISVTPGQDDSWRLLVTDTGVGIAESEQQQLFQPFTRVGQQQAQIEGTGIGLAFTRKLARLMHGQVGLRSEVGVGSTFWIELPRSQTGQIASAPTPGGTLLLYIEDDALSQKLLAAVLARRRPDLHLLLASLGEEGLALAQQRQPALILLDQHLPDMGGAEVFSRLRADAATARIPVFALSGNAGDADREAALASGYQRYLTKPIQIEELLDAISELLPEGDASAPN